MHYAHSRNRDPKTGYKVVRIPMTPEGHVADKMVEPIDFFYMNPIDYRIRPVGVFSQFFHLSHPPFHPSPEPPISPIPSIPSISLILPILFIFSISPDLSHPITSSYSIF